MANVILQDGERKELELIYGGCYAVDESKPEEKECREIAAARTKEAFIHYDADFDAAIRQLSGGTNCVLLDENGFPSVMVILPKEDSGSLLDGASARTHPGWVVKGREKERVFCSKFQNIVYNGKGYSLPYMKPSAGLSFDEAVKACRDKGRGWGLMPASLWAGIALRSLKDRTLPGGNTNFGADFYHSDQKGIPASCSTFNGRTYLTGTGTGPAEWSHSGKENGIYDLKGNLFEWQAGMRMRFGEIQVIPDADCMDPSVSMGPESGDWRALDSEGEYILPDYDVSLKLDYTGIKQFSWIRGRAFSSIQDTARFCAFRILENRTGAEVPQRLKELLLYPSEPGAEIYGEEYFYASNGLAEGMAMRGGTYHSQHVAGLFCTGLNLPRQEKNQHIGFRTAFYGDMP